MAVVQISRIQQRRGRKLSNTGFPQLASGEIGWAIDTQELYIGNGSVSEGSPYVGNTQILTEHVNILDFAEAYEYKRSIGDLDEIISTGPAGLPIRRTLQQRLDERVDVRSFIELQNIDSYGSISPTDITADIQRAIDQLFSNPRTRGNVNSRVILHFGPGEYYISEELRIPPYTHIQGAGKDSTVIWMTGSAANGAVMRTVDGNSEPGEYTPFENMQYLERPRFITIEGLTLKTDLEDTILLLDNADTAIFRNVKFVGVYQNTESEIFQPVQTSNSLQSAVWIRSTSSVFCTENVVFEQCSFENTGYGLYSATDHQNVSVDQCKFYQLFDAIQIGGTSATSITRNLIVARNKVSLFSNTLTIVDHQLVDNQLVTYRNSGGSSIGGLVNNRTYYVNVLGPDVISLRSIGGGQVIDFTSTGNDSQYLEVSLSSTGAINTKVTDSFFDLITRYGFYVKLGKGNTSSGNKYINVGNNNQDYANATYPIIQFDSPYNQSTGDYFERNVKVKDQDLSGSVPFYPCVLGPGLITDPTSFKTNISNTPITALELLRFPIWKNTTYLIDYIINKNDADLGIKNTAIRSGTIHITVNYEGLTYHIHDDYTYTGSPTVEAIEFSVQIKDYDPDPSDLRPYETLILYYNNPAGNGTGFINYTYRMLTE